MKHVISLLIATLAVQASARAVPNELFGPDDNPYGPMEVNPHHDDPGQPPSDLHGDDRWLDLVPLVAVAKRQASTETDIPTTIDPLGALRFGIGPAIVSLPSRAAQATATGVGRREVVTPVVALDEGLVTSTRLLPSAAVLSTGTVMSSSTMLSPGTMLSSSAVFPKAKDLLRLEDVENYILSMVTAYFISKIAAATMTAIALQTLMGPSTTGIEGMASATTTAGSIQKMDATFAEMVAPAETGDRQRRQHWGHGAVIFSSGPFRPKTLTPPEARTTAAPLQKRDVDFPGILVDDVAVLQYKNRILQRQPTLSRAIEWHTEYAAIELHRTDPHTRTNKTHPEDIVLVYKPEPKDIHNGAPGTIASSPDAQDVKDVETLDKSCAPLHNRTWACPSAFVTPANGGRHRFSLTPAAAHRHTRHRRGWLQEIIKQTFDAAFKTALKMVTEAFIDGNVKAAQRAIGEPAVGIKPPKARMKFL